MDSNSGGSSLSSSSSSSATGSGELSTALWPLLVKEPSEVPPRHLRGTLRGPSESVATLVATPLLHWIMDHCQGCRFISSGFAYRTTIQQRHAWAYKPSAAVVS
jgi:hypothetical protein